MTTPDDVDADIFMTLYEDIEARVKTYKADVRALARLDPANADQYEEKIARVDEAVREMGRLWGLEAA
jgi:hypothetical protein